MLLRMDEPASLAWRVVRAEDEVMTATASFEGFFERERDGLFGALVMITGNRAEAEEIAQDAFLALWERWDRVSAIENASGYLYRTAMNVFRRRRRRAAIALRRMAGMVRDPDDAFGDAERRTMVASALAGLTPRQRAALVLTDLLEFTSEEAARMLGIRAVTVRVLSSQGRAALKARMERSDG
jgi:RNA polymerase sigma-70 factor, ECF subfamily